MADDTTSAIRKKYATAYDDKLNPDRTEFKTGFRKTDDDCGKR